MESSMVFHNWTSEYTAQANSELLQVFKMIFKWYCSIFGEERMTKVPCILQNLPDAAGPSISNRSGLLRLTTAVESNIPDGPRKPAYNLAVYIFQLSHELYHYVINQGEKGNAGTTWFEETLCEAMALSGLEYASENYVSKNAEHTRIWRRNFARVIDGAMNDLGNDGLKDCCSLSDLEIINGLAIDQKERSERKNERIFVYQLVHTNSKYIEVMADFNQFTMSNGYLIDFSKWGIANPEFTLFIGQLAKIQPSIVEEKTEQE